jgi:hypothetical protein
MKKKGGENRLAPTPAGDPDSWAFGLVGESRTSDRFFVGAVLYIQKALPVYENRSAPLVLP